MHDDFSPSTADFAQLGEMEIESAGDIFRQCEFIRRVASNAGLIVVQWANDVEFALASTPVLDPGGYRGIGADNPRKRARRVARHAYRSAEALRTTAESAAKLPRIYLKQYADIIQARRNAGKRRTFDPTGGL